MVRVLLLVAGDTGALLLFALLGRGSHGMSVAFSALNEVATTAAPFVMGWMLVAPLAGAYQTYPTRSEFLGRSALAWVVACPIGLLLRSWWLSRPIPLSFALVTFVSALLILMVWRTLFVVAETSRSAAADTHK